MKKNPSTDNFQITLGLSVHRPEMIPFTADIMKNHEAVFLEEPRAEGFEEMLEGRLSVEDYLRPLDVEYPAFSRAMCRLLQELKASGKQIFQIEPFLEALLGIHSFFADGHAPQDLPRDSLLYPVYLAERHATGALLAYYQTVMTGSFEQALQSIERFAREDAARFRLRDSLRAQALGAVIHQFSSAYIEAGVIHYPLWRLLRQRLSPSTDLQVVFLADRALSTLGRKGHIYGPGDQLTLLYIFHPKLNQPEREALLAARALIYSKLIGKNETVDSSGTMPHLLDELACIEITGRLSLDDCRYLFKRVRRTGTKEAYQIVTDFLRDSPSTPERVRSSKH
jgi:hypothetical protein